MKSSGCLLLISILFKELYRNTGHTPLRFGNAKVLPFAIQKTPLWKYFLKKVNIMRYSLLHLIPRPHRGIFRRHRHRGGQNPAGCLEGFSRNRRENRFTDDGTPSLGNKLDERNMMQQLR